LQLYKPALNRSDTEVLGCRDCCLPRACSAMHCKRECINLGHQIPFCLTVALPTCTERKMHTRFSGQTMLQVLQSHFEVAFVWKSAKCDKWLKLAALFQLSLEFSGLTFSTKLCGFCVALLLIAGDCVDLPLVRDGGSTADPPLLRTNPGWRSLFDVVLNKFARKADSKDLPNKGSLKGCLEVPSGEGSKPTFCCLAPPNRRTLFLLPLFDFLLAACSLSWYVRTCISRTLMHVCTSQKVRG